MSALRNENGLVEVPEVLRDPQEPDRLVIPEAVVAQLLDWAFQTPPGAAWLAGYVLGKGEPAWFAERRWVLRTRACEIVEAESRPGNGAPPRSERE